MKEEENNQEKINGYTLSRQWFDFIHETKEMVTPIHTALYFWIIELNNQLQWKTVFGLPTDYSMQAIGTKTYKSYKKALDDLIKWGFINLISKSYNQHTCNQIALVLKSKALTKADDLLSPLSPKRSQSTIQSTIQSTAPIVKQKETIKTIENKEADFPSLPKLDFIDLVIQEFLEVFTEYTIVSKGKERNLAGQLLGLWKKQNLDLDSDEVLKSLRGYFERCKNIPDDWHRNKMSMGHMVCNYNEINNILKNGIKKNVLLPLRQDLTVQDHHLKPSDV
jgi:hypothetical protein